MTKKTGIFKKKTKLFFFFQNVVKLFIDDDNVPKDATPIPPYSEHINNVTRNELPMIAAYENNIVQENAVVNVGFEQNVRVESSVRITNQI